MQTSFDLDLFIRKYITKRDESLLANDFQKYAADMNKRINGKSVLVIGGAGTIGSSYIKALHSTMAKLYSKLYTTFSLKLFLQTNYYYINYYISY